MRVERAVVADEMMREWVTRRGQDRVNPLLDLEHRLFHHLWSGVALEGGGKIRERRVKMKRW